MRRQLHSPPTFRRQAGRAVIDWVIPGIAAIVIVLFLLGIVTP